jgi:hypothetical protein
MGPTVTAAQRDALYDQILDRLSGIGDIEVAIRAENYDAAERIGREYSDDLRLLLDDLGVGDGGGGPVELTVPPEVLRRPAAGTARSGRRMSCMARIHGCSSTACSSAGSSRPTPAATRPVTAGR